MKIYAHVKMCTIKSMLALSIKNYKQLKCSSTSERKNKLWFIYILEYYSAIKRNRVLIQFSSVTQLCLTLWDSMDCSMPGFPVYHQLLELTQTYVHWVGDAIQLSHPLLSPSPPAFNLSQHQGLFQWVSSSHQVAKVLEFQLQHQSFQWTPRTDLL